MTSKEIAQQAIDVYKASQRYDELEWLLNILELRQPQVVVEIGVNLCGTFWAFMQTIRNARLIGIDPAPPKVLEDERTSYIIGGSQDWEVQQMIKGLGGIDFLHIDGDHWNGTPQRDVEFYVPLVRKNGIVAIHDIKMAGDIQVAWEMMCKMATNGHTTCITDSVSPEIGVEWGGIGVIYL